MSKVREEISASLDKAVSQLTTKLEDQNCKAAVDKLSVEIGDLQRNFAALRKAEIATNQNVESNRAKIDKALATLNSSIDQFQKNEKKMDSIVTESLIISERIDRCDSQFSQTLKLTNSMKKDVT
jgi:multidrug resistance efflux pump